MTLAASACGLWNLDVGRHARETLPPPAYLTKSYYDIWTSGLEKLALRNGMITKRRCERERPRRRPPRPGETGRRGGRGRSRQGHAL